MNVIFLDVDGVLNCAESKSKCGFLIGIDDLRVKILKEIVDKTNAKIVLTSTWKTGWNKDYNECDNDAKYLVRKLKKQNLFILDKTKEDKIEHRGQGIYDWLKKHKVENWIVLDDELFDYDEEIMKHLVQTNFYLDGLQEKHINEVIEKIKNIE